MLRLHPPTKFDVSISYSTQEEEAATELAQFIEGKGSSRKVAVFKNTVSDERLTAEDLRRRLAEYFGPSTRFVVPLLSNSYFRSPWCTGELRHSLEVYEKRKSTVEGHRIVHRLAPVREVGLDKSQPGYVELEGAGITVYDLLDPAQTAARVRLLLGNLREFQPSEDAEVVREDLEAQIVQALESDRFIHLEGVGGAGKTRLARAIASGQWDLFNGGVWFLGLEALAGWSQTRARAFIVRWLSRILEIKPPEDEGREGVSANARIDAEMRLVLEFLRDKDFLLVLDNCESCRNAAARVVSDLQACAGARVITTSQFGLLCRGKSIQVSGLSLDQATSERSEAETLFHQRTSKPIAASDSSVVRSILSNLEALPLAIELAAGWLSSTSLSNIAKVTAKNALSIPRPGYVDAPPRQQTMKRAVQYSLSFLDEEPREFLRRLSILPSGFNRELAEIAAFNLLDDPSAVLADLRARYLVHEAHEGRFVMREPVRAFLLQEARHSAQHEARVDLLLPYFQSVCTHLADSGFRSGQEAALRAVDVEYLNVLALIEVLKKKQDPTGRALQMIVDLRLHTDAREDFDVISPMLKTLLEAHPTPDGLRADALTVLAGQLRLLDRRKEALKVAQSAARIARRLGDAARHAEALMNSAMIHWDMGNSRAMRGYAIKLMELGSALGDDKSMADGEAVLAYYFYGTAEFERAIGFSRQAEARQRAAGDDMGLMDSLVCQALCLIELERHEEARTSLRECLTIARSQRDLSWVRIALWDLGYLELRAGDDQQAFALFEDYLRAHPPHVRPDVDQSTLDYYAVLAVRCGEYELAGRFRGAAMSLRKELGVDDPLWAKRLYNRLTIREMSPAARAMYRSGIASVEGRPYLDVMNEGLDILRTHFLVY